MTVTETDAARRRRHVIDEMRRLVEANPMVVGLDLLRRRVLPQGTTSAPNDDLVRTAFAPTLDEALRPHSVEHLRALAARLYFHERGHPEHAAPTPASHITKADLHRRGWSVDLVRKHIGPADVPPYGPTPGRYLLSRIEQIEQDPHLARVLERARKKHPPVAANTAGSDSTTGDSAVPTEGAPQYAWQLRKPTEAEAREALHLALGASPLSVSEIVMMDSPEVRAAGRLLGTVHHARVARTSLPDELARRFDWTTATVSVIEIAATRGHPYTAADTPPKHLETDTARDALLAVLQHHRRLAKYASLIQWGWDKNVRRRVEDVILAHYLPVAFRGKSRRAR